MTAERGAYPTSAPSSPERWPSYGGDSLMLGAILGEMRTYQGQTVRGLDRISDQLEKLIEQGRAASSARSDRGRSSSPERMTWRDWMQLGIAAAVLIAAAAGKIPLKDVLGSLIKPFG